MSKELLLYILIVIIGLFLAFLSYPSEQELERRKNASEEVSFYPFDPSFQEFYHG